MPKMKTHKAGAKRYKITANGKVLRRHAGIGHLLANKSSRRKRSNAGPEQVSDTHLDLISKQLPYKKYSR